MTLLGDRGSFRLPIRVASRAHQLDVCVAVIPMPLVWSPVRS